jgi:hypothetical protein
VLEIERKLGGCPFSNSLEFIPRSGIRAHDLGMLLIRHRPHIFHFSAHVSSSEGIILVDVDGYSRPITVQKLAGILRMFKDDIRIVLLNACYTTSYAEAILQDIDFVIGMDRSIEEEAAIIFASYFYQALACGRFVKEAFELAKTLAESLAPVLLIRQGVKESEPFLNRMKDKTHKESLNLIQGRLIEEIELEPLEESISRDVHQGEEVWRWQSEYERFTAYLVLETNGDLTLHFSTSDQRLEGARLKVKAGPLILEARLQRGPDSESHAEVTIKRGQRPKNLKYISIEID